MIPRSVSVVIPSYRRPLDLARCLAGLAQQSRPVDEIIVVLRGDDAPSWAAIATARPRLPITTVAVHAPGVVAALNVALDAIRGEVVAFLDDDTIPRADWLAQLIAHFDDERVGAVGGRDMLYRDGALLAGSARRVGEIQWFGRQIYNHHFGVGGARDVEILKGCNVSYRRRAIAGLRFDERLRGSGAQLYSDTAFCLAVRRAGWRVVYEPAALVDHHHGRRFDEDQRDGLHALAVQNGAHNETVTMLDHLGAVRRVIFFLYCLLVGTRDTPGVAQVPRLWLRRERHVLRRWAAATSGRFVGLRSWRHA